jgi:hypothetical protein
VPVLVGEPPKLAIAAAVRGVIAHASKSTVATWSALEKSRDGLSLTFPHRIANLPLDRIAPGMALRDACKIGDWRFLVEIKRPTELAMADRRHDESVHQPVFAAKVATDAIGAFTVAELTDGPFVQGTAEAVRRAEALELVQREDFSALLLYVPAIYVVALWLQNAMPDKDILVAIPPSNSGLPAYQPLSPDRFIQAVSELAAAARATKLERF